jgi:AcrR family transcriptional regulator
MEGNAEMSADGGMSTPATVAGRGAEGTPDGGRGAEGTPDGGRGARSSPASATGPRVRDSEAAKARLLQAATDEFAAYGIAGARIDRIGAAARVNKAQIYTYFGNKDQLFDVVLDTHVARILDQVPFTPEDLPGYAGRLFDFLIANPHQIRLATWNRMERTSGRAGPPELLASTELKTRAITEAQAAGHIPGTFTPEDLLVFTMALATAWTPTFPMPHATVDTENLGAHRAAIVEAVRRLVAG